MQRIERANEALPAGQRHAEHRARTEGRSFGARLAVFENIGDQARLTGLAQGDGQVILARWVTHLHG